MKSLKTWQRNQETDLSSSKKMLTSHNIVFTLRSLTTPCPPEAFREVRSGGNPTNLTASRPAPFGALRFSGS